LRRKGSKSHYADALAVKILLDFDADEWHVCKADALGGEACNGDIAAFACTPRWITLSALHLAAAFARADVVRPMLPIPAFNTFCEKRMVVLWKRHDMDNHCLTLQNVSTFP
jgi:hypothetical protein